MRAVDYLASDFINKLLSQPVVGRSISQYVERILAEHVRTEGCFRKAKTRRLIWAGGQAPVCYVM